MARTYFIKTLGCKANFYDSQLLETHLRESGLVAHPRESGIKGVEGSSDSMAPAGSSDSMADQSPDICVVNSCTVTDEADKESRRQARLLKKKYPNAKIIMTGCGAEVDPEKMRLAEGVDFVIGNQDKARFAEILPIISNSMVSNSMVSNSMVSNSMISNSMVSDSFTQKTIPGKSSVSAGKILGGVTEYSEMVSRHPMDRDWPLPEKINFAPLNRTRAFLKIQEGCNSFCTFCIIPYGRGPSRSLKPREIIDQVKLLVDQGIKEVVLTGTNIGDYGVEWLTSDDYRTKALDELVKGIVETTGIFRLRVSSLDPTEISPFLMELAQSSEVFCPHFHVSLQSPHSKILKLMKRRYGFSEVRECLEAIADINTPYGKVFVGMDLITGFPGEDSKIYEESLSMLRDLPWTRIHVFPYSERANTPATRLKGEGRESVERGERKRRAREIMALSLERLESRYHHAVHSSVHSSGINGIARVLIEGKVKGPDGSRNWLGGYSPSYLRVLIPERRHDEKSDSKNGNADRNKYSQKEINVRPLSVGVNRPQGECVVMGEEIF